MQVKQIYDAGANIEFFNGGGWGDLETLSFLCLILKKCYKIYGLNITVT
jgi:hypothetical protein